MSCQDVCIDCYCDLSNEFYREAAPRAAKAHQCVECFATIAIGEVHQYATGKCDGDFWNARTCAPCAEIRTAFSCGGFVIGTLWEDARDQLFPQWNDIVAIDCLAKLKTDAAIGKMRAQYLAFCEDNDRDVPAWARPTGGTPE